MGWATKSSSVADAADLRRSPLHDLHVVLGAKMAPFGGWSMPIAYPSGTLHEHRACREDAVVFDVSHLGSVRVEGPSALATLQAAFTNDLGRIEPGRAQYTHLLDPHDASVLDDIIVWWVDDDLFDVMPNASNTDRVRSVLADAEFVADRTERRAVLAVQGPFARERLQPVVPVAAEVGRFRVTPFSFGGESCLAAGTGYTGEDGVELAVPVAVAADLWTAVTDVGIVPAGLGARDTLRLEAGLPLHGHELGPGITPLQAGLGWVVRWDKGPFRGRDALAAERENGVRRRLVGLVTAGRRPPRDGQRILVGNHDVGFVSSGNFSPILEVGIAMAFVEPTVALGTEVTIDMRGTGVATTVVDMPFVS
jgi:aminomethyltransferase